MIQVEVWNGDIEQAIRRLKKLVAKDGVLQSLKRRLNDSPKPSHKRKEKARRALKRNSRNRQRRERKISNADLL